MDFARNQPDQNPVRGAFAPLFDRLSDLQPETVEENPSVYILSHDDLCSSIRDQLVLILNTRNTEKDEIGNNMGQGYHLPQSFGLPDFSDMNSRTRNTTSEMARRIEQTIMRFEPRLQNVVVTIKAKNSSTQGLQIQISASLTSKDHHERIHFPLQLG